MPLKVEIASALAKLISGFMQTSHRHLSLGPEIGCEHLLSRPGARRGKGFHQQPSFTAGLRPHARVALCQNDGDLASERGTIIEQVEDLRPLVLNRAPPAP